MVSKIALKGQKVSNLYILDTNSYTKQEKSVFIPKNERKYATIAEVYKECEENLQDYLHPNISLKLSSPYLDQYMSDHIFKKDNKSKWIDKKGFKNYINSSLDNKKYLSSYTNFVPGILPNSIKFREENKKKWVDKKGFIIKNAKDYLIKATEEYNIKHYQDLYD